MQKNFLLNADEFPSLKILDLKIPIVDIRRVEEWKETGIIKGAIAITFFDKKNNYNMKDFLEKLNKKIDTKKPFSLICKSGHRTKIVSDLLSKDNNYKIINLKGGMIYAKNKNLPIMEYK